MTPDESSGQCNLPARRDPSLPSKSDTAWQSVRDILAELPEDRRRHLAEKALDREIDLRSDMRQKAIDHEAAWRDIDKTVQAHKELSSTSSLSSHRIEGEYRTGSGQVTIRGRKGICFVATVAFGDCDAPEVRYLRRFRASILRRNCAGRVLISIYYRHGPLLARFVGARRTVRCGARKALIVLCKVMRLAWRP